MPAELDNPISIMTGAPVSTSEISIKEIVIRPPGGTDYPGGINLVIAQGDGADSYRIPGSFLIADNSDPTRKERSAGKEFEIPVGNFFSDIAASAPTGGDQFTSIKTACYQALMARYPSLNGNVT